MVRRMTFLTTVLVSLALAQNDKPEPLDVSAFKDKLSLLTDGKSHYVAFVSDNPSGFDLFHSGDGKTFSKVRVIGGGRSGDEQWSVALWDPRMWSGDGLSTTIDMKNTPSADGGFKEGSRAYSVTCGRKTTTISFVPPAEAKKIFDGATFVGTLWTRVPEKLLRDDKGTYYLVDRFRTRNATDRRDFRVFAGRKGSMKQLPLKDIVDDSKGMIFSTKNGNLRLITGTDGKSEAKWVQGKEASSLVEIDLDRYDTARLVYLDLGPYTGARLGTPCDDFN